MLIQNTLSAGTIHADLWTYGVAALGPMQPGFGTLLLDSCLDH